MNLDIRTKTKIYVEIRGRVRNKSLVRIYSFEDVQLRKMYSGDEPREKSFSFSCI